MALPAERGGAKRGPRRRFIALAAAAALAAGGLHAEVEPPAYNPSQQSAAYLGEAACSACHRVESGHFLATTHARVFRASPGNALEGRVCEACHGPGSLHLTDPRDRAKIMSFTRASAADIDRMNGVCLACHQGGERLHWIGSAHHGRDLACADCHNPMAEISASGLLAREGVNEVCLTCHQQQRADFRKRSHMPLFEGKIDCVDCHNPHGTTEDPLLRAETINQLCYGCHAEKRGPFLFEHAPVRENCLNCHAPHGSNHEKLLVTNPTFLCQQCHANVGGSFGHPTDLLTRANAPLGEFPDPRLMNRGCVNCHAQIHGSNHPAGARFHR
jgi:DmsE family decaheme c-type cytochrome